MWLKLPPLPDPGTEDTCIAVSDWLTQIQPSDLSDRSMVAEGPERPWEAPRRPLQAPARPKP